jgi:hypothetical protein
MRRPPGQVRATPRYTSKEMPWTRGNGARDASGRTVPRGVCSVCSRTSVRPPWAANYPTPENLRSGWPWPAPANFPNSMARHRQTVHIAETQTLLAGRPAGGRKQWPGPTRRPDRGPPHHSWRTQRSSPIAVPEASHTLRPAPWVPPQSRRRQERGLLDHGGTRWPVRPPPRKARHRLPEAAVTYSGSRSPSQHGPRAR